jgi:hypothetical protein
MSSKINFRDLLTLLLPSGAAWNAATGLGLDQFLNGMAANLQIVKDYLEGLGKLRDPLQTPQLEDLEREYGIISNTSLSDTQRRQILRAKKGQRAGTGSYTQLQDKLDEAGFDLVVQENNPKIDPDLWIGGAYQIHANNTNAIAGNNAAYAGYNDPLGRLIVNSEQFVTQEIRYSAQANGTNTVAGNSQAVAGYFTEMTRVEKVYTVPDFDVDRWNYIFYVGGPVTDWTASPPVFERGEVPAELEAALIEIILQHKPTHSWCGLVVDYI